MPTFLLYGANGYTGRLIAREAVVRGLRPVLAGRNAVAVGALARELGLEHRIFSLDDAVATRAGLEGVQAVLHCAGPFAHTAEPMVNACLEARVHYLDITGEIRVFERLAARDTEAMAAGILLLPGAGFDVVPTDCLAAHLHRRLPAAKHLALAFHGIGRFSRGTATTIVENLHEGGVVRRGGALVSVPSAWRTRDINFGEGPRLAVTIPWGDVSTAYRSTGISDIEVYTASSRWQLRFMRLSRFLGWALRSSPVQTFLKHRIQAGPPGPTDEERARGRTYLWGEVEDAAGRRMVSRLRGPEGYTFTMLTALAAMARVLAGDAPPGYQTPSLAYGPDFVLEAPGVERVDE
ncbi:MAG TPA: saccharopine dehydrogenase NADP-binding domain-containing protein [Gemmataceae bacterium]|nr:saccharopine dehydrogenase NADP-binding domain-containing protein [Gemmataceae bacterium]